MIPNLKAIWRWETFTCLELPLNYYNFCYILDFQDLYMSNWESGIIRLYIEINTKIQWDFLIQKYFFEQNPSFWVKPYSPWMQSTLQVILTWRMAMSDVKRARGWLIGVTTWNVKVLCISIPMKKKQISEQPNTSIDKEAIKLDWEVWDTKL